MWDSATQVEVVEIQQDFFRNHRDHLRQIFTERNKADDGNALEFSKVVWFNFGIGEECVNGVMKKIEHPKVVWVRYTHDLYETPHKVSFYKKSNFSIHIQPVPPLLYQCYPLPIKAAKANDLQTLATQYLPSDAKGLYINLPTIREECLQETDSDSD